MSIDEFISRLNFSNGNELLEEKEARFYLKMKGVALHLQVAKYLGHDISQEDEKISWIELSSMLRYDKKLRDKLYIYIATLEEYIRAYISNKYENDSEQDFWIDGTKDRPIKSRIVDGEKVSIVLCDSSLGSLIKQVKALPDNDKEELFEIDLNMLNLNLDAVVELRNAISHHYFLTERKLKECSVDGVVSNALEQNIKNLRQLLPIEYRYGSNGKGGITAEINNCRYETKDKEKSLMVLPEKDIIVFE